jgi:uncharacterized membrane protein HdeD (DUF308 family)
MNLLATVVGILALLTGVASLFQYFRLRDGSRWSGILLAESVIDILFGLVLILFPEISVLIISILLGIWVVTGGMLNVFTSLYARQMEQKNWWLYLLLGIFIIVLGITMFVHPAITTKTLLLWIGIVILIFGILNLYKHIEARS